MGASQNPGFIPTAVLLKNFLAYILIACGAAQIFARLAFG